MPFVENEISLCFENNKAFFIKTKMNPLIIFMRHIIYLVKEINVRKLINSFLLRYCAAVRGRKLMDLISFQRKKLNMFLFKVKLFLRDDTFF